MVWDVIGDKATAGVRLPRRTGLRAMVATLLLLVASTGMVACGQAPAATTSPGTPSTSAAVPTGPEPSLPAVSPTLSSPTSSAALESALLALARVPVKGRAADTGYDRAEY